MVSLSCATRPAKRIHGAYGKDGTLMSSHVVPNTLMSLSQALAYEVSTLLLCCPDSEFCLVTEAMAIVMVRNPEHDEFFRR